MERENVRDEGLADLVMLDVLGGEKLPALDLLFEKLLPVVEADVFDLCLDFRLWYFFLPQAWADGKSSAFT